MYGNHYSIKKNINISKKDLKHQFCKFCVVQCLYFQPVKHLGLAFYFYWPKDVKIVSLYLKDI